MSGSLKLVDVHETEGRVVGTFEYSREGRDAVKFQQEFNGLATAGEIGATLVKRCGQIVSCEPSPALAAVQDLFKNGARTIADQPAAPDAPPPPDQPS